MTGWRENDASSSTVLLNPGSLQGGSEQRCMLLAVIVDDVCRSRGIAAYRTLLDGHRLQIVQVTGDLGKIEQRERERGDRLIGLARAQAMNLHDDIVYDQDISTTTASPEECAKHILDALA